MTIRTPVSAPQNIWSDAQEVDDVDLDLEQNYNNTIDSSIINNHIGDGILPETLIPSVLFDSSLTTGVLDGVAIYTQSQPSDKNFGNQLQISLTGSIAAGKKTVKVAIIGLDFQSNLQYETFYFRTNEIQVSQNHYTKILLLLFNDLVGNPVLSLNLGGRLVISEAAPLTLSREPLLVAQDQQPNLFFRDFFVANGTTLNSLLQTALPLYNISSLNIMTAELEDIHLAAGDVTTQLGEKFLATTDNIQKITLLLSVQPSISNPSSYVFTGDLVISIYPLQSTLECPTDLAPDLPIDYPPSNIPLVQVSDNYTTLAARGVVLNSVPQPVDFVFSNSPVATAGALAVGNYYAVTIKRSGSANACDILVAVGGSIIPNSRVTTFASTLWVDLPNEQLWFQVWTDAAKVSDGQAYDSGDGITIPKTILDTATQVTVDNNFGPFPFSGGETYQAVLSAVSQDSNPVPDQRTGNPVDTVQQFVPKVQLLNPIDITNLEAASEPLIIGAISDQNIDSIDLVNSLLSAPLYSATMVNNQLLVRIVDDPTDAVRFNSSVTALATSLLNGAFVGAQIFPDASNPSVSYRIAQAQLASMITGDINGDGIIDNSDVALLQTYLGYNMNIGLPVNSSVVTDGYTTTFVNGYTTLTVPFAFNTGIAFQLVNLSLPTNNVVATGGDGYLVPNPTNPGSAQFASMSVNFSNYIGLSTYALVIVTPSIMGNYGGFSITGIDAAVNVITINKIFLTGSVLGQILRADIDGDFVITSNDGYLLQEYVARSVPVPEPTTPYPGPTSNAYNKIGTPFNVIIFDLEQFVDRADDYTANPKTRASNIHPTPDIFLDDGYFASHNFYNNPSMMNIQELLTWDESLIISNSNPRFVPTIFSYLDGVTVNACGMTVPGITYNVYPTPLEFDPGRIDVFVPNNLIIGSGGEIQRPDGNFYKVDFEVGTIVLEIPDGLFGTEKTLDILNDFVVSTVNGSGIQTGVTRLGFPAMRFSDCTYVTPAALAADQLRFSVAVQSFSPNTNGLSSDGYYGAIVDGKMGVNIDYATGFLTLNFTNLYQDPVLQTLSTKVQVNVFLKKGSFNNAPLFVTSTQVQNMLSLVSVFSGANVGGTPSSADQAVDVSYTPAFPSNFAGAAPTTTQQALDRMAALLVALKGGPIP